MKQVGNCAGRVAAWVARDQSDRSRRSRIASTIIFTELEIVVEKALWARLRQRENTKIRRIGV